MCLLHRMCTRQFAITINISCNFCKTDVAVSVFSLSLFFFLFFLFFFADDGSRVKVSVSTVYVVAGSLVMHHLLGSVMYALFF